MYHTNINAESCHIFAIYMFRLVESYKSFCVRPPLEILRKSTTIFRSSHCRCSIETALLKHFVIFVGKHLWWGLFFNKVAGHLSCNCIKKRLQHIFFWEYLEIYSNNYFEVHLGATTFLESVLWKHFSDWKLGKGTFGETKMVICCVKGCSN